MKYFLLGAFASAFFLYGLALLYGYAGSVDAARHRGHAGRGTQQSTRCCSSASALLVGRPAVQGSARRRSTPGRPDVYQGAPTPVTAFMAACTKVAAFGAMLRVLYVAFGAPGWDWRPVAVGRRDHHDGGRRGPRPHPDRREADAGLLVDRARRLHPGRRHRARPSGPVGHDVLPAGLRLHHDRRVRRRHPGPRLRRRGDPPVAVGRPGPTLAAGWPRCSRCSCSRSPASR